MELQSNAPAVHFSWVIFAFSVGMCRSTSHSVARKEWPPWSASPHHGTMNGSVSSPGKGNVGSISSGRDAGRSERRRVYRRSVQPSELPSVMTSETSGYVTSGFCSVMERVTCPRDASFVVVLPEDHVTLLSFPVFDLKWFWPHATGFVQLSTRQKNGETTAIWKYQTPRKIVPELYYTSVKIRFYIPQDVRFEDGFKMIFSIHPVSQTPPKLSEGVFNCSVPFYDSFKEHFDCNLVTECPGGRDEGSHCPLTVAECPDSVAVGSKCFVHVHKEEPVAWTAARQECDQRGGNLATVKNPEEWNAFLFLLKTGHIVNPVYVGLRSFEPSMPSVYRGSYIWVDDVVNYRYGARIQRHRTFYVQFCFVYNPDNPLRLRMFMYYFTLVPCDLDLHQDFICEVKIGNTTKSSSVSFPEINDENKVLRQAVQTLIQCPPGHFSHNFLVCDPNSKCGADQYVSKCNISNSKGGQNAINMFDCDHTSETLPFTLVCDFRQDCADGSDETFCVHSVNCVGFLCTNGQCISKTKQCNVVKDCWDGSDELCTQYHNLYDGAHLYPPPSHLSFDSDGNMKQSEMRSCALCPQTHFCCPDGYCVPLYCRCNGLGDCEGKEDEVDCQHFQCPGLYRCRSSSVCVHADHLCDGWPQCPQHDDEWLCHADCPQGCVCQGHAFLCWTPFPLAAYPYLRYVDAAGSGITTEGFTGHTYLVWLSLARSFVRRVSNVNLPNLRFLDLSHNEMSSLNMSVYLIFKNLRILDLSNNPLVVMVGDSARSNHKSLTSIDLSGNQMTVFNTKALSSFPKIRELNLSYSTLTAISGNIYQSIPNLAHLDMRGSRISEYFPGVFKNLDKLITIWADNYKLCCRDLLPQHFDPGKCSAPVDEISSCEDLLRSDTYRAFLWLLSTLSVAGNVGCVVTRLFLLKRRSLNAFSIFVTNLSFADLIMGVYLALVGTADYVYRGEYFWFEEHWKPSVACQIAGFLSLLSSETSAFIICLITLDRFLVLSSPFSDVRFKRRSAGLVCFMVWVLGFCFAAVPLLPVTKEWEFYSQTGICVPLPITRTSFKGRNYAFGVIIVLNFVLFLLIATGQAMIYWTIRTTSMAQSSTRKTKDLTIARRLITVVVSDFLCWFPIGLLGLLSASGTPIPGEVNVGMAIFVLPLNAALNPFLYTFNTLTERWDKMQEKRLLRQLEARSPALREK